MRKRFVSGIILILSTLNVFAQIYDPVKWNFRYEKTGDNLYDLVFSASIEENSHIYSIDIPAGGPIPTSFSIDTLSVYKLVGKTSEVTKPVETFDEAFGFKIKTFSKNAEFRQRISSDKDAFTVRGIVNYMACNNITCSPPKDVEFEITISDSLSDKSDKSQSSLGGDTYRSDRKGLFGFILISLLAGFAGVLTPCVFPMIPMTVAFFSKQTIGKNKTLNTLIYGLSIIIIYTSVGIIVSLSSAGAGLANTLSTHWIPNIIFFLLFIIFAASFFGAFEIILPSKWVTAADSKVDRGGVFATFFMGLTTVIVSFSCTGPIVGALLVEAASGEVIKPTLGMFGFGLAFSLPFTVFALFPSIMEKIPRSGAWLNSVKIVLGFIIAAFSLKFLSTIDSVYSLGIISRDLFISIWVVIFSLLGLYLMGKIKFKNDGDLRHIGIFRLFLIISVFSFVIYLATGLFGAPLKELSPFLPAKSNSWFSNKNNSFEKEQKYNEEMARVNNGDLCSIPKYGDIFDMPLGLSGYFDYKQGLECAKAQGKPVLLDFKGFACSNCKLMEAKVWSDADVYKRLRDNFVIISLYVDSRFQLPEKEWITSSIDGRVKKTIGKINEDLEISKFNTNSLPLYAIIDSNGKVMNDPVPANFNIDDYIKWLDEGVNIYKSAHVLLPEKTLFPDL